MLDDLASLGSIRIATVTNHALGTSFYTGIVGGDSFFNIDTVTDAGGYYISDHGKWISADNLQLTLAHELAHADYNAADPVNDYGLTNPAFDFKGTPVTVQNAVAGELGHDELRQASYHAALPGGSPMMSLLTPDQDYTDGNPIDISIFGTNTTDDNINLSSRTDGAKTLLFGFGGDDTLTAASGNAYLYGGTGDDSVVGGAGNDHLFGEAGDDTLSGGAGNDTLNGGGGTDQLLGSDGNDRLVDTGGAADGSDWRSFDDNSSPRAMIEGGAGNDTLVASTPGAVFIGGPGDDVIDATGNNAWDALISFSAGDGHDTVATNLVTYSGLYGTDTYTESHVWGIDFGSLTAADLELHFTNWHLIHAYPDFDWVIGDLSIVVKATGDSISVGRTDAYLRSEDGSFDQSVGDNIFNEISRGEFGGIWSPDLYDKIASDGGLIFG
jgi:hypothetical protein